MCRFSAALGGQFEVIQGLTLAPDGTLYLSSANQLWHLGPPLPRQAQPGSEPGDDAAFVGR